jgi:hypothetical protein
MSYELNCDSCEFWEGKGDRGLCRINPPVADSTGKGVWPETAADDWCSDGVEAEEQGEDVAEPLPVRVKLPTKAGPKWDFTSALSVGYLVGAGLSFALYHFGFFGVKP